MNIGKACAIFAQIEDKRFTRDEKLIAIHEVMNMPTHMGITKDKILTALKWLWNSTYELTEAGAGENNGQDKHDK